MRPAQRHAQRHAACAGAAPRVAAGGCGADPRDHEPPALRGGVAGPLPQDGAGAVGPRHHPSMMSRAPAVEDEVAASSQVDASGDERPQETPSTANADEVEGSGTACSDAQRASPQAQTCVEKKTSALR